MRQNELALLAVIRWRKLYGFRSMTTLDYPARMAAAYRLREYLRKKGNRSGRKQGKRKDKVRIIQ